VTGAYALSDDDRSPASLLADLAAATDPLIERIATTIQERVGSYAGPATGRRRWLIGLAVQSAVRHFFDVAHGRPTPTRKVDDLFAKMGHGEATDGNTIEPLLEAIEIAILMSWDEIRAAAVAHQVSATVLSRLGEILHTEAEQLRAQVRTGHAAGRRAVEAETARPRLVEALLTRSRTADLRTLAGKADWSLPEELVIAVFRRDSEAPPSWADPAMLVSDEHSPGIALIAAADQDQLVDALRHDGDLVQTALSWPVPPSEAADAHRWTRRTLDLARRGVLPGDKILHCRDHRTQLWLHAEPSLRRQLCQELLPPLLAETPNSREILSETLLVWLETRESAPAIAGRLDVHPQTVRYRWKRINELFGEALHDPEAIVALTMLLKASVPMWKAGDQSDFERFQAEGDG